jgi:hypothetical protein
VRFRTSPRKAKFYTKTTLGRLKSITHMEISMAVNQATPHFFKADTRAMRVSAAEAQRQLSLALWLVGLLVVATLFTATLGFFA